jgi:hypothetical protein
MTYRSFVRFAGVTCLISVMACVAARTDANVRAKGGNSGVTQLRDGDRNRNLYSSDIPPSAICSDESRPDGNDASQPKCVVLECDWLGKCWCPTNLPGGRKQPLSDEECREVNRHLPELPPDLAASFRGKSKGERNHAAKPSGTDNEFKKLRPHPTDPNKVIYKDPHTGKSLEKA